MKRIITGKPNLAPPYQPIECDPADIGAIKALCAGVANDAQQLRFVAWMQRATAVGEMSYRPDDRDTAFAEGKRFVGIQFFTLAKAVLP